MLNPLGDDLRFVLAHTRELWEELRGARLFLTGGTGFFGCWLLETFLEANRKLGLRASATVLTRYPGAFVNKAPHLATHPAVHLHPGDVREFEPPAGKFSHVIHAATQASADLNRNDPLAMLDTIAAGTRRTLDFALGCGASRFLLVSSGAVYGRQAASPALTPETCTGGPDATDPSSAYAEGKRAAELLTAIYAKSFGLEAAIARGFAFVGPYLPLDAHFAAGNFIRDGLLGGPIRIARDGTACRSYLYAADLAIWLWTILLRGRPGRAYNVGSEEEVTIAELAHAVADQFQPRPAVLIGERPAGGHIPDRYVPSTARAREELGLQVRMPLPEALRRTVRWARAAGVCRPECEELEVAP